MKMPVDIKEVMKTATDTDAVRNMPVTVSVYFDPQSPDDLFQVVCRAFSTAAPNASVRMVEYPMGPLVESTMCDMAVLVAGMGETTGQLAAALRQAGVPVLTVTTMPEIVKEQAEATGYPLLEEDVVAPEPGVDGDSLPQGSDFNSEPYPLTVDRIKSLLFKMGEWVVDTFRDKRLAFALAFPFVRRPLSLEFVNATAVQNAGIGLVVLIPGADMPVMTLNQAKMLLQIAAAYDQALGKERLKELAAVVGGGFACRAIARQLVSVAPGWGWVVKGGIGFAGTIAMGYGAIAYFDQLVGEGVTAEDALAVARSEAIRVKMALREGGTPAESAANVARTVVTDAASGAVDVARRLAPSVKDAAVEIADRVSFNPSDIARVAMGSFGAPRTRGE